MVCCYGCLYSMVSIPAETLLSYQKLLMSKHMIFSSVRFTEEANELLDDICTYKQ